MQPLQLLPGTLICRSLPVDVPFNLKNWGETGFLFPEVRRRLLTRAIVCHWTAAENPPAAVYNNMLSHAVYSDDGDKDPQPLSVHFVVDAQGIVWQMMDTDARGAHCKAHGANGWTVGIEFVCRGSNLKAPMRSVSRPRSTQTIHGQKIVLDDLTPRQVTTGVQLCEVLCNLYGLPVTVPETSSGELITGELSDALVSRFSGVCGHLHLEARKHDPGLTLLQAIQARGRELQMQSTLGA